MAKLRFATILSPRDHYSNLPLECSSSRRASKPSQRERLAAPCSHVTHGPFVRAKMAVVPEQPYNGSVPPLNSPPASYEQDDRVALSGEEYQDLTGRLNEFQLREQTLLDRICTMNGNCSPDHGGDTDTEDAPIRASPLTSQQTAGDSTKDVPKSPMKSVVRAFLPNQQRTTKPFIRQALIYWQKSLAHMLRQIVMVPRRRLPFGSSCVQPAPRVWACATQAVI
ncbi:hypothetical protein HPB51_012365 [Rhipicephalus microplus]|uniref:Uncharacterized protein n=1 Tax=Rhipicephalus microplus TaxID=6941 RepID=A0A9J6DGG5_RHIMP|nr:hypothetical protein HPB51_012365 [Rhipicephalus microplus]